MHERVTGYCRVSTAEQGDSRAGLEAQRAAILAEADSRGWTVVDVIEDVASAKDLRRPGVPLALEALEHGEASALVIAKLDRLSRSMLDLVPIMARAQRERWALVALDCPVDTSTPLGEAMTNIVATFAQLERRLIGQRTREALAVKRAEGVRLGRPRALPKAAVERILSERAAGASFAAIADGLNADGVPTAQGGARWWPATVRKVAASRA